MPVPPMNPVLVAKISDLAARSKIASYEWRGRGQAPVGYTKGMALVFARCCQQLLAGETSAVLMAGANSHIASTDALSWYAGKFKALGMSNDSFGVDSLRHLFALMMGLGMRESSGNYSCGRDRSSSNTSSTTAEAGLFQMSWNASSASPEIAKLYDYYSTHMEDCFLNVFKEGVRVNPADLENYGSGQGAAYQKLAKSCPAFATEMAAVGLRVLRSHWGPINRYEAELVPAADDMLKAVEKLVFANPAPVDVVPVNPPKPPAPSPDHPLQVDFAHRLQVAMDKLYPGTLLKGLDKYNIISVEGTNPDGSINADQPNSFDDVKVLLQIDDAGNPRIAGSWEATTKAGKYWTRNPMREEGAAVIALGPQTAWRPGEYHGTPALLQVEPIHFTRDPNMTWKRYGREYYDSIGVHHHGGYDMPHDDMGRSSAGCQVIRKVSDQLAFYNTLKKDSRWRKDLFSATVLSQAAVATAGAMV